MRESILKTPGVPKVGVGSLLKFFVTVTLLHGLPKRLPLQGNSELQVIHPSPGLAALSVLFFLCKESRVLNLG